MLLILYFQGGLHRYSAGVNVWPYMGSGGCTQGHAGAGRVHDCQGQPQRVCQGGLQGGMYGGLDNGDRNLIPRMQSMTPCIKRLWRAVHTPTYFGNWLLAYAIGHQSTCLAPDLTW